MRRSGWMLLAALVALSAPAAAQYPGGGMGGMGGRRGNEGRRREMGGGRAFQDIPTEPEAEGPPDLQTLSLSADVDTTGLAAYGVAVKAYLDSTRAVRDSVWVVLQRMRPGGDDATAIAPDPDATAPGGGPGGGARRGGFDVLRRTWPALKKRDEEFVKSVLKRALPKKDFKKWKKWHDDEVDQAQKDRADQFRQRMGGGGRGDR